MRETNANNKYCSQQLDKQSQVMLIQSTPLYFPAVILSCASVPTRNKIGRSPLLTQTTTVRASSRLD